MSLIDFMLGLFKYTNSLITKIGKKKKGTFTKRFIVNRKNLVPENSLIRYLALAVILLCSGCVTSQAHNYKVVVQLQDTKEKKITPSILRETGKILSSNLDDYDVPHQIESIPPDKVTVFLNLINPSKEKKVLSLFETQLLSFHLVHSNNKDLLKNPPLAQYSPPHGYKLVSFNSMYVLVEIQPVML